MTSSTSEWRDERLVEPLVVPAGDTRSAREIEKSLHALVAEELPHPGERVEVVETRAYGPADLYSRLTLTGEDHGSVSEVAFCVRPPAVDLRWAAQRGSEDAPTASTKKRVEKLRRAFEEQLSDHLWTDENGADPGEGDDDDDGPRTPS